VQSSIIIIIITKEKVCMENEELGHEGRKMEMQYTIATAFLGTVLATKEMEDSRHNNSQLLLLLLLLPCFLPPGDSLSLSLCGLLACFFNVCEY
jgi:hypothetical protein